VAQDWERLARSDPLWAVYVAPGKRRGGWDREEFLATGRREVDRVVHRARALAPQLGSTVALDFGCGAGRLSAALRRHFDHVVGVDASPSMLATARDLVGDDPRLRLVQNAAPHLGAVRTGSVDLAYSSLVLQHLPRPAALRFLAELLRITKPDGCVAVQVVSRPDWSVRGVAARVLPARVVGVVQRRLLGYPAAMLMTALPPATVVAQVERVGGRVLGVEEDRSYGSHWHATRWYMQPAGQAAAGGT
jgi:SAM-dependent methyltransferase